MTVGTYTNYCISCKGYMDYMFAFVCIDCQEHLDHDYGPEKTITLTEITGGE